MMAQALPAGQSQRKHQYLPGIPPTFTKKKEAGWWTTEQFAEKKQCDYALLQN